jgi:hypothetical protein
VPQTNLTDAPEKAVHRRRGGVALPADQRSETTWLGCRQTTQRPRFATSLAFAGDSVLIGRTPLCRLRGILVACCSQEVTGQPGPAILLNLILDKNCYLQYLQ